jgi:hypothetical protein
LFSIPATNTYCFSTVSLYGGINRVHNQRGILSGESKYKYKKTPPVSWWRFASNTFRNAAE